MPPQRRAPMHVPGAGVIRWAPRTGFGIRIELSPVWDRMAREFSGVCREVLEAETLAMARGIADEMIHQISVHALPRSFTGRLAGGRITWRKYITRIYAAPRIGRTVTIGLRKQPPMVPAVIGQPVRYYASAIELGTAPHSRPWGRLSRERLEAWAAVKLGSRRAGRYVMSAIYRRGTPAYPYFLPAARATTAEASRWLEEGGRSWRDRVETRMTEGFATTVRLG